MFFYLLILGILLSPKRMETLKPRERVDASRTGRTWQPGLKAARTCWKSYFPQAIMVRTSSFQIPSLGQEPRILGHPKNARSSSWQWEITHWHAVIDDFPIKNEEFPSSCLIVWGNCSIVGDGRPPTVKRGISMFPHRSMSSHPNPVVAMGKTQDLNAKVVFGSKIVHCRIWDHPILVIQSCWTNPKKMSEPGTRTWSRILPVSMGTTCKIFHIWQGGAIHFHSFSAS